ncbi:patatin family protein [Corynebacterium breve]|uniref:Patatin family protein n=1 Tax=Corynebacterium breve TaxID=3049799 RepID=A0ABY8VHB4_9CORY|nr:patatin family protein [Corynebacterium breve]WIM68467.1 patatin family protein [Corynebacterium breve]
MIDARDTALVIEGGGMRNSYTAGAIARFIEKDVQFGWVGGVSAGSSHLCSLLSRDADRAKKAFTSFAGHPEFGGWQSLLRGTGYFNAEFIYENSDEALPFDFATFQSNPAELHIDGCRADTGETVSWTRKDIEKKQDILVRVRASSTMPLIMPMRVIDGAPFVDGALGESGGLLIGAAERAGFSKFAVLTSRTRDYWKSEVKRPETIRRLFRKYPAVAQAQIDRPARYNASKQRIIDLEESGKAKVFFPETMPVDVGERNVSKLLVAYNLGLDQIDREWESWMQFLQLS